MDVGEIRDAVARFDWRHSIDLGHGIVTPGADDTPQRLHYLALPESLKDKTVLDVGANDGFYSFEAERRGAARVVALDLWNPKGPVRKERFELARRALRSSVEDMTMDVLDISPELGRFDIVLFLGVLYHLRHPLLALERLFSVTNELLIIESHVDLLSRPEPMMAFYPGGELNNDHTNWWGPNPRALRAMVRAAGFRTVQTIMSWPPISRRLWIAARCVRRRPSSFWTTLNQKRMVVHARP